MLDYFRRRSNVAGFRDDLPIRRSSIGNTDKLDRNSIASAFSFLLHNGCICTQSIELDEISQRTMKIRIDRASLCLCICSAIACGLFGASDVGLTVTSDRAIYQQAIAARSNFLQQLAPLVNIDSGTGDLAGLTKVENIAIAQLKSIGADVTTTAAPPSVGRVIRATFRGTGKGKILLLAHTDTVFPRGTAALRPFKIVGNRAYAPGVMDDKGGISLGIAAIKILREINFKNFDTMTFLINPDEEGGSVGSRSIVEATAKQHDVALVLEFGSPQDKITSWRKGIGAYGMEIQGKAAHAGAEPEKGCNALVEAAHQTIQLSKLGDSRQQTTVNVTVLQAGDRRNIIPARATIQADVRVLAASEFDRLRRDFQRSARQQVLPCTNIQVLAAQRRPPFPANARTDALVAKSQAIYREIGLELGVEGSGGATDGNFTAAVGTTTLDALGPVGGGAHSDAEYIEIDRIAPRIYLLARLLMELGAAPN
jgi:glutamate carboxypeptidase